VGHVRRLIAFDLDGTLIDSRRDLADSANQLITELGGASLPEEAIGRMVGDGAAVLVRRRSPRPASAMRHALPRF
jgi:phosphoglycolate phosphatase